MLMPFFVGAVVKEEKVLKRVDPMQVVGLQTVKNYTKIFLSDETYYEVRSSLAAALKKLPAGMFIRINRSQVVSIYFIDDIGKDYLVLGGIPTAISRRYYRSSVRQLNIIE